MARGSSLQWCLPLAFRASWLCMFVGCYEQVADEDVAQIRSDVVAEHCGDGVVGSDEECDPAADGWQQACDAACNRTVYRHCESQPECDGPNDNCASYTRAHQEQFCANLCQVDADCPVVPDFESACNFAWCAVLCRDGQCPNNMRCVMSFDFIDGHGQPLGQRDVCVVTR